MRIRNPWFEGGSFLLAVFMLLCAANTVAKFLREDDGSVLETSLVGGVFLLLAIVFLRNSMIIGRCQKRFQELREGKLLTDDASDINGP